MLIQHLLTERLFRTVFNNPDFTHRNVIASEIESVIRALTSHVVQPRRFSRQPGPLLPCHRAHGRDDQRLFAEAALSEHGLRAVFPGFFGQGGGYARDCVYAAADRRLHGEERGRNPGAGVWPFAGGRRGTHHRPVRGHGQLHRAHDARDAAHCAGSASTRESCTATR